MTFWHLFWVGPLGELSNVSAPTYYPRGRFDDADDLTQWGVLGLTPIEFLAIVSTTTTRVTQVGFAAWSNFNPAAQITQVGFGSWSYFNPEARITQVGFSIWGTTNDQSRRLVNVYYL